MKRRMGNFNKLNYRNMPAIYSSLFDVGKVGENCDKKQICLPMILFIHENISHAPLDLDFLFCVNDSVCNLRSYRIVVGCLYVVVDHPLC